jgi:feruloyl esterase
LHFRHTSAAARQADNRRSAKRSAIPADYDGLVAGDPGNNRFNLIYGFLWSWLTMHDTEGTPILPSAKLPALTKAAIAACDKNDGLQDGLIGDP